MSRFARVNCKKRRRTWVTDWSDPRSGILCKDCGGYGHYYVDRYLVRLVHRGLLPQDTQVSFTVPEMAVHIKQIKSR